MHVITMDAVVRTETWFPRRFADAEERPWGVLFSTPEIPDSHDGNHACILRSDVDHRAVVTEIVAFYEERQVTPRVYYLSASASDPRLVDALFASGFMVGHPNTMRVFVHQDRSVAEPSPAVHVRCLRDIDDRVLAALATIENVRMAKVLQRRLAHPDAWLFLGEIDGQPASVALLERFGEICRVDEVHTVKRHRRRGCARAVIHALVAYQEEHASGSLYLWTESPVAEQIYVEAGFRGAEYSPASWVAWREG
ncbi:MAG: GNAT family N-acetyltransferase [Lentisphaerae bacterium]|jgi:GNAT superfamily N-acetyltransferase|nr:GNAT family N-acetyltransferase [Lentisphaerota bacterium]MBT4822172.1 GNAT family N-acetyltransferase [Lentisphaerota bacterium]MBT5612207.1 GNAT family N-acetyltransferase [Lentisphaerota bacterium]MBT7061134.1 GNAT family N-acetyltransferase [Lentisphaerota bacterium]MBT7843463.1 GNAT family N-acetyltransferase [Lentisphaerota bacterium]